MCSRRVLTDQNYCMLSPCFVGIWLQMAIVLPCTWLLCLGDKGRGKEVLRWRNGGTWSPDCSRAKCRFAKVSWVFFGLFQPETCNRLAGWRVSLEPARAWRSSLAQCCPQSRDKWQPCPHELLMLKLVWKQRARGRSGTLCGHQNLNVCCFRPGLNIPAFLAS